jgi:protoporphyrin/coproporphyrin ferrochelatase
MDTTKIGLLVMAYGTPARLDEVGAYYTHIRRGNPPSPEKLQELIDRYTAIGGVSPLNEITREQVQQLEATLNEKSADCTFKAYPGMKHTHPFIEEAVEQMAKDGIEKIVGIVLAPHFSSMSIGAYIQSAKQAIEKFPIAQSTFVRHYHLEPHFIQAIVERVREALQRFAEEDRENVKVLFTAHSLPVKILETGDPYPTQLRESAAEVASQIGLTNWEMGWQSAGQTAVPWLGPDILERMQSLHEEGVKNIVICPIGFVSDHLEVLYDNDVECQNLAHELGMHMERTASLNADPLFIEALAQTVLSQIHESEIKG